MDTLFKINNCAAILLAAGASLRFGKPKQLLSYNGKSFLQNMVSAAKSSGLNPIIVVVGAHATLISDEISESEVHTVHNQNWEEGMASSIRCGIQALEKIDPASDGTMLMVCDQPHVAGSLLHKMLETHRRSLLPIVACSYANTIGTPALFHRSVFSELLQLKGDKGAKQILTKDKKRVGLVDFPLGSADIDTEEDYSRLLRND